MRLAVLILTLLCSPVFGAPSGIISDAKYAEPTRRYDHGILGDAIEWGALVLTVDKCVGCTTGAQIETVLIRLPDSRVFEDIAPRLITDKNGQPLVMVVETDLKLGARLALYDQAGLRAATPFIGQSHRWLAPIGAADLDGDGNIEVAYIDRPHLAKRLRIWRLTGAGLVLVAQMDGLTNHRIGWDHIPGGLRDCGAGLEMVMATGDWHEIIAGRLTDGQITTTSLGRYTNPESLNAALNCP